MVLVLQGCLNGDLGKATRPPTCTTYASKIPDTTIHGKLIWDFPGRPSWFVLMHVAHARSRQIQATSADLTVNVV